MTIDDILNQQFQPRAPVQNDIPGILSQILAMGQGQGMPQLPQMDTSMPQIQMQALPDMQQNGSGIGKSLVAQYLQDYMEGRKTDKAAKQRAEIIAQENPGLKDAKGSELAFKLLSSQLPERQQHGMSLLEKLNIPDPDKVKIFEAGVEGKPTMRQQYRFDFASNSPVPIGPAWQPQAGVNVNLGNPEAPLSQFEMEHMVDSQGNPVAKIPLGMKRGEAASKGMAIGKTPTETEAKTAGSTMASEDMAARIRALRSKGESISGLPGAIVNYRTGGDLIPSAVNASLEGLGYKVPKGSIELISLSKNLSNQLLQAMRGAQVGPQEQEAFEKSLPVAGQPEELFDTNLETTMRNLKMLNERKSQARGYEQGLIATPPAVGTVMDGYIFKGGDPSKQENWSKQ